MQVQVPTAVNIGPTEAAFMCTNFLICYKLSDDSASKNTVGLLYFLYCIFIHLPTWLTKHSHIQDKWTKLEQKLILAIESAMYWSVETGSK